jgi:hypothetical protein
MPPAMAPRPKPPERTPLPDGSTCLIEWHVFGDELGFTASRIADGITVWGQVFHPDPRHYDAELEAAHISAKMSANPAGFDVRRLWCAKCGQTAGRSCAHSFPYRLDHEPA